MNPRFALLRAASRKWPLTPDDRHDLDGIRDPFESYFARVNDGIDRVELVAVSRLAMISPP
jgi:hypothetical protein